MISNINIEGGEHSVIQDMIGYYERDDLASLPNYRSPEQHDAILRKYGVRRDEVVFWNFDIKIYTLPKDS